MLLAVLFSLGSTDVLSYVDLKSYLLVTAENGRLVRATGQTLKNTPTTYFWLTRSQSRFKNLNISLPPNSSIFIEGELHFFSADSNTINWKADSIFDQREKYDSILFAIFNESKSWSLLEVYLKSGHEEWGKVVNSKEINIRHRKDIRLFKDEQFTIFFTVLFFASMFRLFNSRSFNEALNLNYLFSLKFRTEADVDKNVLTPSSLLFMLLTSMIMSGVLVVFIPMVRENNLVMQWLATKNYVIISTIIFLAILFKYLTIRLFSAIFYTSSIRNAYFFEYLRISFVFYSLLFCFAFTADITYLFRPENMLSVAIWIFGLGLTFRTILMYLKTASSTSLRHVHLFSYLCPIEIIPLLVLFNIFFE